MVGEAHPRAPAAGQVVDSRSVFFPDSEDVMGWEINDQSFHVALSQEVPA